MKLDKALEGWFIHLRGSGYAQTIVALYSNAMNLLTDYLVDTDVKDITREDLEKFFGYLQYDYVPNGKNNKEGPPIWQVQGEHPDCHS
jgi:hypothetical protein